MKAFLLLLLIAPIAHANPSRCARLRYDAVKLKLRFPPSQKNFMNCGAGNYRSSNYRYATDPEAPVEMHLISVEKGSFPPGPEYRGKSAPTGAVRVLIFKTERPVLLVLSAAEPTLWELSVNKDADVDRIVLQGPEPQVIRGEPDGIPIIRRREEAYCRISPGWEPSHNRGGSFFKEMVRSVRCAAGLRESSFQGCFAGAVFEVPYYRRKRNPAKTADWTPPCPLPVEPGPMGLYAKSSAVGRIAVKRGPAAEQGIPERSKPIPHLDSQAKFKRERLSAPEGIPLRGGVPSRVTAILENSHRGPLPHDAVPGLILALERGDILRRSRAADVLGQMGPDAERAVGALLHALEDPSVRMRSSAALALGNIGRTAAKAVPLLKKLLRHKNADLRLSAETALERIGTRRAIRILRRHRTYSKYRSRRRD